MKNRETTKEIKRGILLFDIDGTLMYRTSDSLSAGKHAMDEAGFILTGKKNLADYIDFAGATDQNVANQILKLGGIENPSKDLENEFLAAYSSLISQHMTNDSYTLRGKAIEVISKLIANNFAVGIATGNIKKGAEAKLENTKIDHLFNLDLGGYGEDGRIRTDIVKAGIKRITDKYEIINKKPVIIGDTPFDIYAAHKADSIAIGIPYSHNTAEVLRDAGADFVCDEIDDTLVDTILAIFSSE
ncbi:MAG: HAD family hydrolase [Deltaproteobacteria bacterium]|nr:HAD family hydrolase [Deltaproteobacteria bacterium]